VNHEIYKSIRKTWSFNPATKVHSSPKGARGYSRSGNKDIDDETDNFKSVKETLNELDLNTVIC
jgi:hypothetical protein